MVLTVLTVNLLYSSYVSRGLGSSLKYSLHKEPTQWMSWRYISFVRSGPASEQNSCLHTQTSTSKLLNFLLSILLKQHLPVVGEDVPNKHNVWPIFVKTEVLLRFKIINCHFSCRSFEKLTISLSGGGGGDTLNLMQRVDNERFEYLRRWIFDVIPDSL